MPQDYCGGMGQQIARNSDHFVQTLGLPHVLGVWTCRKIEGVVHMGLPPSDWEVRLTLARLIRVTGAFADRAA